MMGRVDWEGKIRAVRYPWSFVKEIYLSPAHGLSSVREDFNLESTRKLSYILVKHRFRNSMKDVQTLPGADIDFDHNLLGAKICTRFKKIAMIQKGNPRWDLETLHVQRQRLQNNLEENSLQSNVKVGMWKCGGKYKECCVRKYE